MPMAFWLNCCATPCAAVITFCRPDGSLGLTLHCETLLKNEVNAPGTPAVPVVSNNG